MTENWPLTTERSRVLRPARLLALRPVLDRLSAEFEQSPHVDDPVRVLSRYPDVADREIAAFIAAGLAFGRVRSVIASVDAVLAAATPRPAQFVRGFSTDRDAPRFRGLVHRWTRDEDLVALILVLRHMLETAGSVEQFFVQGLQPGSEDVGGALESFSTRACAVDVRAAYRRATARPGVRYFFPRPSAGSACKRLNLFLRWMVRRDAVDPGGWTRIARAQLIVPLDVHVVRLGRCLRLTRYSSPGWRMAAEITRSLRVINPDDPIRYDFALCHIGMRGDCGFSRPAGDLSCPLRGACRPTPRKRPASRRPSGRR